MISSYLFKDKNGFTLAEILITLGIIGVVAAITLPVLMHNYKAKEMRTRLLRANSIIQNGIGRMVADEVNVSELMKTKDYNLVRKYFKDGSCIVPKNSAEGKYKNYGGLRTAAGASAQTIKWPPYCLVDGMLLWFATLNEVNDTNDGWNPTDYTILIVDINGWKTPPDMYGKDVFFWFYNPETERVHPFGRSASFLSAFKKSASLYNCPGNSETMAEAGIGCTEKALSDESYFKNLKF